MSWIFIIFSSSRTHQYSPSVCLSILMQVKTATLGHRKRSTLQSPSDQNHFLNNSRRSFCKNEVFSGVVTENPFFFVNFEQQTLNRKKTLLLFEWYFLRMKR